MTRLSKLLEKHEGLRLLPYRDSRGYLTIGVGRCIEKVGISKAEAYAMLDHDILAATREAQSFSFFWELDDVRQDVLICMVFNIGAAGLRGFRRMLAALALHDYETAADEMLSSEWARQVGRRAEELSTMMRTGEYET